MLKTDTYISISDVQVVLDQKYHQNFLYDYLNAASHFDTWCDKKKYGQEDKYGNRRGSSQIWFQEYENASDGACLQPKTLNFFDYLQEHSIIDGNQVFLELPDYESEKNVPAWVSAICRIINSEFGHLFPSGEVKIRIIE